MSMSSKIPDKTLLQGVNQKLSQSVGSSQNKITAAVGNGTVTLTGTIQYEHHRRHILRTASTVRGIRRVVDQLKVAPKKKAIWKST